MFITVNSKGKRVIYDGEALDYECCDCGRKFERLIDSGCCCPCEYIRKQEIEKNPTVCPHCNSRNVKRDRSGRKGTSLYEELIRETEGRELEEWED